MSNNNIEFDRLITPDGEVYKFDNANDRFMISFTGLGMPPITYITQRGPLDQNETVLDFRLQPRIIQLIHRRNTCSRLEYWMARADIVNHLRPNRQDPPLAVASFDITETSATFKHSALRKILPDRSIRDIRVLIQQGPAFSPRQVGQWDEWSTTETLRFIAHDPIFYDPTERIVNVVQVPQDDHLIFFEAVTWIDRAVFPIQFGADDLFVDGLLITYPGTWFTQPVMQIIGPLSYPTIQHKITGKRIELDYVVLAGETVTIDLRFGFRNVISDINGDITYAVTQRSDFSTFAIEPDPTVPGGNNTFVIHGNFADANTIFRIRYIERYIGI